MSLSIRFERAWEDAKAGIFLGSQAFIARMEELLCGEITATNQMRQRNVRVLDAAVIRQIVESHYARAIAPRKWSNALPRLIYARLARQEAIASLSASDTHST